MRLFTWYNVVIQRKEEKFMSDFIFVVLVIAIVVTFVMTFVRLHQGEDDSLFYLISWIVLLFGTFFFIVFSAYNDKENLYFTDVRGKSYVYKNVTHVSTGKNNIIYFTDKNGNNLQFNIASLKETEAK